jgi:hypothetical protein
LASARAKVAVTHNCVQVCLHAFLIEVDRIKVDRIDEVEIVQACDLGV